MLSELDWYKMFAFSTPAAEIFIRGTVMYLGLFILLRVILKRESSGLSMSDLLVIVLLADASQNAMAGDYTSISDGILLVLVIIGWSYVLNWLSFKSKFMERIIKPGKLLLIKNGKLMKKNMREEMITVRELMSELRKNGLEKFDEVYEAYMESDGTISFITGEQHKKTTNKQDMIN